MSDVKIYDLKAVSVIFGALDLASGAGEGSFLKLTKKEDDYKVRVGADGTTTRYSTNDRVWDGEITFDQSSPNNALLSAIRELDRLVGNGAGVAPFLVKDGQGTGLFAASKCWISKPPDLEFKNESTDRTWKFQMVEDISVLGGN